jgi:hypothetical protein
MQHVSFSLSMYSFSGFFAKLHQSISRLANNIFITTFMNIKDFFDLSLSFIDGANGDV